MAHQAEAHLERELAIVNGLNVFPVPDGDTGSNMLATVRAALAATEGGSAAERLAQGALMGARGNSGVILSQLFRAQADMLRDRPKSGHIGVGDFRGIFIRAAELAREAISQPVEGTMLSVFEALGSSPFESLEQMLAIAEQAVAHTPDQLPILRQAGVVDSGAYGLLLMLRGWYEALSGTQPAGIATNLLGLDRVRQQALAGGVHPASLVPAATRAYGKCITLLVESGDTDEVGVRQNMASFGDSVLVVAAGSRLKLHVHASDPALVMAYARALGTVISTDISDIDEQTGIVAALPLVAVTPGEGLAAVFRGLGAVALAGGPTQNPSTAELLAACGPVLASHGAAFLLPNNANILGAARQAATTESAITVVPTRSVPQGIAAALAFVEGAPIVDNLASMTRAAEATLSVEIVRAARAATINGVSVQAGDSMVILDGELIGVGASGLEALIQHISAKQPGLATIYYGAAASLESAESLRARLLAGISGLEVEIVRGDQPHAEFILSFE